MNASADPPLRVLLVDDESDILEQVGTFLGSRGFHVTTAPDGPSALEAFATAPPDLAVVDYRLPGMNGLELIRRIRERHPDSILLMMTAHGTVEAAVEALKAGAQDFLLKPTHPEALEHRIRTATEHLRTRKELEYLRRTVESKYAFSRIVGTSRSMRRVFQRLETACKNDDLAVLITGETGTGKELVARALHFNGPRKEHPYVVLDCGALPESLLESELFGHVQGAFTGAGKARLGRFMSANGGTLLLDELAAAPEHVQVRLLRVLEERCFVPLGSDAPPQPIDVRVVAAMNVDPEEAVEQGTLRQDLYYRLNVLRIDLPPLRERKSDIPLIASQVLEDRGDDVAVDAGAMEDLLSWSWPGNVRELRHVLEAAAALAQGGRIRSSDLRPLLRRGSRTKSGHDDGEPTPLAPLKDHLMVAERNHIEEALRLAGGSTRGAARLLGLDERSLRRKLRGLGVDRQRYLSSQPATDHADR